MNRRGVVSASSSTPNSERCPRRRRRRNAIEGSHLIHATLSGVSEISPQLISARYRRPWRKEERCDATLKTLSMVMIFQASGITNAQQPLDSLSVSGPQLSVTITCWKMCVGAQLSGQSRSFDTLKSKPSSGPNQNSLVEVDANLNTFPQCFSADFWDNKCSTAT